MQIKIARNVYSEISDGEHSKISTTCLQRTQLEVLTFLPIYVGLVHYEPSKEDNLLTKDNKGYPKM